jgi:hypothetical protein
LVRYICECGNKFHHTAKITIPHSHVTDGTVEFYCCPECQSTDYDEYVLDQKRITSVVSVALSDVDARLKEGYEVESLYAKTATLVRRD